MAKKEFKKTVFNKVEEEPIVKEVKKVKEKVVNEEFDKCDRVEYDTHGHLIADDERGLYRVIDGEFVLKSEMKAKGDAAAKAIIDGMRWKENEKKEKDLVSNQE